MKILVLLLVCLIASGCASHPKRSPEGRGIYFQIYLALCEYETSHKHLPPVSAIWLDELERVEPKLKEQLRAAPEFQFNKVSAVTPDQEKTTVFLFEKAPDSQNMRVVVFYDGDSQKMPEAKFQSIYRPLLEKANVGL